MCHQFMCSVAEGGEWPCPHLRDGPSGWGPPSPGSDYPLPFSLPFRVLTLTAVIIRQNGTQAHLGGDRGPQARVCWKLGEGPECRLAHGSARQPPASAWSFLIFQKPRRSGRSQGGTVLSFCEGPTPPPIFQARPVPVRSGSLPFSREKRGQPEMDQKEPEFSTFFPTRHEHCTTHSHVSTRGVRAQGMRCDPTTSSVIQDTLWLLKCG